MNICTRIYFENYRYNRKLEIIGKAFLNQVHIHTLGRNVWKKFCFWAKIIQIWKSWVLFLVVNRILTTVLCAAEYGTQSQIKLNLYPPGVYNDINVYGYVISIQELDQMWNIHSILFQSHLFIFPVYSWNFFSNFYPVFTTTCYH